MPLPKNTWALGAGDTAAESKRSLIDEQIGSILPIHKIFLNDIHRFNSVDRDSYCKKRKSRSCVVIHESVNTQLLYFTLVLNSIKTSDFF
jgi:hypothetical protein